MSLNLGLWVTEVTSLPFPNSNTMAPTGPDNYGGNTLRQDLTSKAITLDSHFELTT
jgi:hypothetical protein